MNLGQIVRIINKCEYQNYLLKVIDIMHNCQFPNNTHYTFEILAPKDPQKDYAETIVYKKEEFEKDFVIEFLRKCWVCDAAKLLSEFKDTNICIECTKKEEEEKEEEEKEEEEKEEEEKEEETPEKIHAKMILDILDLFIDIIDIIPECAHRDSTYLEKDKIEEKIEELKNEVSTK